ANPGFVDLLNDDLRPTLDSPLRNAGTEDFVLSTLDLSGEARINEGRVDIGAYENSDRIFANGFELVE
ncbi:MAG: choice-of-anchor Q domain-containing protein, partial [Dokdonella sp.]